MCRCAPFPNSFGSPKPTSAAPNNPLPRECDALSDARPTCEPLMGGKDKNASSSRCAVLGECAFVAALEKDAALCERWNEE